MTVLNHFHYCSGCLEIVSGKSLFDKEPVKSNYVPTGVTDHIRTWSTCLSKKNAYTGFLILRLRLDDKG